MRYVHKFSYPRPQTYRQIDLQADLAFDEDNLVDPGSLADDEPAEDQLQELEAPPPSPNPSLDNVPEDTDAEAQLDDLKISQAFIDSLRNASLDEGGLDANTLHQLRHPPQELLDLGDERDLRLAIELFLQHGDKAYTSTRQSILRRHPEDDIPSYDQMTRKIVQLTGVDSVVHDMCPNSCVGYTGPFATLDNCPECGEPRYDPILIQKTNGRIRHPRQQFHTIPVGPQLQALWRSPETANLMHHRIRRTEDILNEKDGQGRVNITFFDDFYTGSDYLRAVNDGHLREDDITLMFSIDGAQLYHNKQSDCVIYIWVVLDLPPQFRYMKKYVLIGGIIPGPNKLKHLDSYIYPSLHHLIALQTEGLCFWDANRQAVFLSRPFFVFGTADSIGIVQLNGQTGHHGAYGCRMYCAVKGRRKEGGKHYYPALLKPTDYDIPGCNHGDVDVYNLPPTITADYDRNLRLVLASPNNREYKINRRETGISKPSIISAISPQHVLGVPASFVADLMHLTALNITDLKLGLFRGTIDCNPLDNKATWDWMVLQGNIWINHGKAVADAMPYLPGSFDRPP